MLSFKVANDNGNNEQDMFINDYAVRQPNVYAKSSFLPNFEESSTEGVLKDIHNNLFVTIEGSSYFIGSYALRSGKPCRSIEVGTDNNKVSSNIVYVNTLAHIAGEAAKVAYLSEAPIDQQIEVKVEMATSLPVSYYSKEQGKIFASKFANKAHLVTVYAGAAEISVKIMFDFVKIIPEGVTAAHAFCCHKEYFETYNKSHSDKITCEFMKTARVLHIAIGEGTTEFPVTYNGLAFDPNFIVGTNNGNGHAIDRVLIPFQKEFGLRGFTRQEYSEVLKDETHNYHETAMQFIETALEDEAYAILSEAKNVIQATHNNISVVCVYGGGSIMMRKALETSLQDFCDRARIKLLYIDAEDAVMLKAVGLNEFVHSDLFQKIKQATKATKK